MKFKYLFATMMLSLGFLSACNFGTGDSSGEPIQTFTVTWKDYDDTILEIDENVLLDEIPTFDQTNPVRVNDDTYYYVFSGWTPEIMPVAANIEYMAVYNVFPILEHINDIFAYAEEDDEITITGIRESAFPYYFTIVIPNQSKANPLLQLAVGHLWITLT